MAYRRGEHERLAHEMAPQDSPITQDATCTGRLWVMGIAPVSYDILLEQNAQARDHDTWQALMAQAFPGLKGTVRSLRP